MSKKTTGMILGLLILIGIGILFVVKNKSGYIPQAKVSNNSNASQKYTMAQVSEHSNASSCWTVIDNKVYDITQYVSLHPGGSQILSACGIDSTSLFNSIPKHQGSALNILPDYLIGALSN